MKKVSGFIHRHLISVLLVGCFSLLGAGAYAVHMLGVFELTEPPACTATDPDDDVGTACDSTNALSDPQAGDDWEDIVDGTDSALIVSDDGLGNPIIADPSPLTIFTTGGSKDDLNISSWRWTNGNVPDKDDILDAFAALYQVEGQSLLYFGLDRLANNGDAQVGFWLFKGPVGLNADGTFAGLHTVGDILVLTDFTKGGELGTVKVLRWVGSGGNTNNTLDFVEEALDCDFTAADGKVCGNVNTQDEEAPWPFDPKFGTEGFFPSGSFYEAGVNLTVFGISGCFSNFLAETRSSQSVDAQLKDFVLGMFDTCGVDVTKQVDAELSKVGDTVSYTVTIENTGIAPLFAETISDSVAGNLLSGGTTNTGVSNVNSTCGASGATLAPGATCTITYDYTIQGGAADPLANTVTISYREENNGGTLGGQDFASEDSASLNLFQPSVDFTKSGPSVVKTGDEIDYTYTLTNTSSGDTPDLTCTVTDADLGLNNAAISFGSGDLGSQTAPGGDSVSNTASVTCSIDGFPNTVGDSDGHTVDLFQPSVEFIKSGPSLAKTGDEIDYTYTLTNTSSGDTPDLTCTVTDADLGLNNAAISFGSGDLGSQTAPGGDSVSNTASVTCSIDGFPNTVGDSDDHTVDLFQPSVAFTKSGPSLAKTGDEIDYTYTLTDTSSANTPDLSCAVTDTDLGLNGAAISFGSGDLGSQTAPGGSSVTNTASVTCSIAGFPNTVGDSDGHTVDLFQPSIEVTKSGDDWTKVGDTVSYAATIENTSSANTPALVFDAIMDSLAGDLTDGANPNVVSSDCGASLATGVSCTVDFTYVTQEGDDDGTLNNTVTVATSPTGFPNDVDDSDDHEATILHPDYSLDKSCQAEPAPLGSSISFFVTLINTGDVALEIELTDPDLVGSPLSFTLGVVAGACDDTALDNGDPSDGCHRIEGAILADTVGSQLLSTASGVGTIDLPGLPNEIERMDDTTCDVEDVGATRTLGFWKTHGSDGDNDFPSPVERGYTCHIFEDHMDSSMDLGWKQVTTCEELFGIFWAHPSRQTDGSKRDKSCKAQIGSSDILAAALLNQALDNGAAIDPQLITDLQNALASGNFKAIKDAAGPVNAYNESGDDEAIIDNDGALPPHADPNGVKAIADFGFADCN